MTEQTLLDAARERGLKISILRGAITSGDLPVIRNGNGEPTIVDSEELDAYLRREAQRQRILIVAIEADPKIRIEDLAKLIGRSTSNAHHRVQALIRTGQLRRTRRYLNRGLRSHYSDWRQDDDDAAARQV